ncbi:hypothetical protein ACSTLD_24510, partial [Vibrio parahaemolyticus]
LKLSFFFLGFAIVGGLVLLISAHDHSGFLLLVLGLLGLGAATFGLLAIAPTTLILDQAGFARRSVFRTREYTWSDFARFRWYTVRG